MRKRILSVLFGLAMSLTMAAAAFAEEYIVNIVVDGKPVALSIIVDGNSLQADSQSPGVEVGSIAPVVPMAPVAALPQTASRTGTANRDANLRGGPGTNHPIVGGVKPGQVLAIVGNNPAGDWLQVGDGKWISASLVTLAIAEAPPALAPVATPTTAALPAAVAPPTAIPTQAPTTAPCDPSYPGICIPPYPPDLNCGDLAVKRFQVVGADPHGFDKDNDGIGCES